MTAEEIYQGQWVADGLTIRPYIPSFESFSDYNNFQSKHGRCIYATDLPNGIYEASELGEVVWQGLTQINKQDYGNWFFLTYNSEALTPEEWKMQGYKTRQFLTTKEPMKEESKEKEVWQFKKGNNGQWTDESEDIMSEFKNYKEYEQLHFDANKTGKLDISTRIKPSTTTEATEGEAVEQAADNYSNKVAPNKEGEYYHYMAIDDAFKAGSQWQSQHTAKALGDKDKQINELNLLVKYDPEMYKLQSLTLTDELAESQARVKELEEALREIWPLSTNAFGELSLVEIKGDSVLFQLNKAIDNAKKLLSNPNNQK